MDEIAAEGKATKPLNPYQGLKRRVFLCYAGSCNGDKTLESLPGIETQSSEY